MTRLELTGQPRGVPPSLVLRIAPDQAMGEKELAVQETLAQSGYPTPAVRARGVDDEGRPWALMDFVDGVPLLAGLEGPAALRRAPRLLVSLASVMADALANLHQIDPEPVTAAVQAVAPSVAWRVEDLLVHLAVGAEGVERPDLAVAVERLTDRRPPEAPRVVCHGDFHPFNILTGGDGSTTVVDWTGALLAPPAFDLAYTTLLLSNPPLAAGPVLRPVVGAAGRVIARRFLAAYRRANPGAGLGDLVWYRALHSSRILIEHASIESRLGPEVASHPFAQLVVPATSALGEVTGEVLAPSS
jgi:aminoglycoside phosphotransferase (APT) family kinase protein